MCLMSCVCWSSNQTFLAVQAGAGGAPGLSPPLPLGSPSFWQPFGVSRGSGDIRNPPLVLLVLHGGTVKGKES